MANFVFRLKKVLEFRRMEEGWAKREVAHAALEVAEIESAIDDLNARSEAAVQQAASNVTARLTLLDHLRSLDESRRILTLQLGECEAILAEVRDTWLQKRADLRAMEALEERERADWMYAENRRESNALDEWAVLRRAA